MSNAKDTIIKTRRPRKALLAGIAAVVALLGFVGYTAIAADAAANTVSMQRSTDADAWSELRLACADEQAAHIGPKDGIEQCTDYADQTLQAAKRESMTLAAYIVLHNKDLHWLPAAARERVARDQRSKLN
jgi:hypothetical protein